MSVVLVCYCSCCYYIFVCVC